MHPQTYTPHCEMAWAEQVAAMDSCGDYLDRQPMTQERLSAIVNYSLTVAREVAALPVKTDLDLHRALVVAKAANEAIDRFNAQGVAAALIARVGRVG